MSIAHFKNDIIEIPRGKLVGYNGPGSLYVNTEGITFTISAVDKWYASKEKVDQSKFNIYDSRLEKLLNVSHFKEVPSYRNPFSVENKINSGITIPVSRFPLLHYCTKCGHLQNAKSGDFNKDSHCMNCNKRRDFVQFPIVTVCQKGHMDDFPYFKFVHHNTEVKDTNNHKVFIDWSGKDSILNWSLRCSCGAKHSLTGVSGRPNNDKSMTPLQKEMNGIKCTGRMPWASNAVSEDCEHRPEAILKNSLRIYQPQLIPVLSLSDSENNNQHIEYNQILHDEFNKLSGIETEEDRDKLSVDTSFQTNAGSVIEKVNYIRRLQEIIVQTGFNRLSPVAEEEAISNIGNDSSMLFSNKEYRNWFPAKRMYGEGIFIEFNTETLEDWANQDTVRNRFDKITKRIDSNYESDKFNSPIDILIHTLSHNLIREFSNYSGYSMTATKEKLYFLDNKYGLLIYVTDTDKDGTFGGLVRLAEENIFKLNFQNALNSMEWCSSDPVCSEIGRNHGQGLGNTNGSACHNCSFVPSTSCPHRNCYLDRDFVGRSDAPECITYNDKYSWFNDQSTNTKDVGLRDIKIVSTGREFFYADWFEAKGYEPSNYYLENNWSIPDYMDGRVKINSETYGMKYLNEKNKQIVLYADQDISKIKSI